MKNLLTFIIILLGVNLGFCQVDLTPTEKKQVEIIQKGILEANKQEKKK